MSEPRGDGGLPRPEHPQPQFRRSRWMSLNGWWDFQQDPSEVGLAERWYAEEPFGGRIRVPFPVESLASGVGDRDAADVVWYRRRVAVPGDFSDGRVLLHFGAVDYRADVWWDGQHVGRHEGGHTPFTVDLTDAVPRSAVGDHRLVVRAEDRRADLSQPRGKQYWKAASESIFYTRTTGIWQSVWIEAVPAAYLVDVLATPHLDDGSVRLCARVQGTVTDGLVFRAVVTAPGGSPYGSVDAKVGGREVDATVIVDAATQAHILPWSPEAPHLYDVRYQLVRRGEVVDDVESYLGFRSLEARDGQLFLNGRPYFLKMVLDQGYFPTGILTAPTADDLKQDVLLAKQMGFNGVRKHQKVEDPLWIHWCDRLGLLVWGEMANSYRFTPSSVERITREWMEVLRRDHNHPAIVAWVPINESWGVPDLRGDAAQRAHVDALTAMTRALDPSRLVVSNDGWEHTQSGDLCTVHDYVGDPDTLAARYGALDAALGVRPSDKDLYVPGHAHRGEPLLVTEMGGIAFSGREDSGWGYSQVGTAEEFLERYRALVRALADSPLVQGFCYTQLTDVEQEVNGLLTNDRRPKVPLDEVRQANAVRTGQQRGSGG